MKKKYNCIKCDNSCTDHKVGEMRVASGFWTKIFNIQSRKFRTVTCNKCGFTEFYEQPKSGTAENILDFLTN